VVVGAQATDATAKPKFRDHIAQTSRGCYSSARERGAFSWWAGLYYRANRGSSRRRTSTRSCKLAKGVSTTGETVYSPTFRRLQRLGRFDQVTFEVGPAGRQSGGRDASVDGRGETQTEGRRALQVTFYVHERPDGFLASFFTATGRSTDREIAAASGVTAGRPAHANFPSSSGQSTLSIFNREEGSIQVAVAATITGVPEPTGPSPPAQVQPTVTQRSYNRLPTFRRGTVIYRITQGPLRTGLPTFRSSAVTIVTESRLKKNHPQPWPDGGAC